MKLAIRLNGFGLILGLAATAFLYLASTAMPWAIQTWSGETTTEQDAESAVRRKPGSSSSPWVSPAS